MIKYFLFDQVSSYYEITQVRFLYYCIDKTNSEYVSAKNNTELDKIN